MTNVDTRNAVDLALDPDCIDKLRSERDEWKKLAGELRNRESRIGGILSDVNWDSSDQVLEALIAIDKIVNES